MQANDHFKINGALSIRLIDKVSGKVLRTEHFENLVVDTGKLNVAKLLGGDAAGEPVDKIGVGDSNTAAAVTDTALSNAFTRALNGNGSYAAVTYPANGQVQFAATILDTEANGTNIWEFGLFNTSSALIARKVLSTVIAKTSSFSVEVEWILKVL